MLITINPMWLKAWRLLAVRLHLWGLATSISVVESYHYRCASMTKRFGYRAMPDAIVGVQRRLWRWGRFHVAPRFISIWWPALHQEPTPNWGLPVVKVHVPTSWLKRVHTPRQNAGHNRERIRRTYK